MLVKVNEKGQVTLPAQILDALGVQPGDELELVELMGGFVLRAKQVNTAPREVDLSKLGYLRDKISPDAPPFDIHEFRKSLYGRLRD